MSSGNIYIFFLCQLFPLSLKVKNSYLTRLPLDLEKPCNNLKSVFILNCPSPKYDRCISQKPWLRGGVVWVEGGDKMGGGRG